MLAPVVVVTSRVWSPTQRDLPYARAIFVKRGLPAVEQGVNAVTKKFTSKARESKPFFWQYGQQRQNQPCLRT